MRGAHLFKHGQFGTRVHTAWRKMVERCTKTYCADYGNYGGRGIEVCERWMSFENFWADMGEPPAGMTLERNDVNGDYAPSNCRWASRKEQNRNRRDSVLITFNGRTQAMAAWAEEIGIRNGTLWRRLRKGWLIERALTEPINNTNRKPTKCSI